jgi:hypothetical protein
MVAYEFYWLDEVKGYQLIGVLPERRTSPERITQKSILKWGEKIFGKDVDTKDIFFIQVARDEMSVRIFQPTPFATTQKEFRE